MVKLLGFEIINIARKDYISRLAEKYIHKERTVIVSGNPEILYTALHNDEIKLLCRKSDIIPDGIGVIISGRITGQRFVEKVAGIDVLCDILTDPNFKGGGIYLLGAKEDIVQKAAKVCSLKYNAEIAGYHDGYFNIDDCKDIIDDINKSGAGILFVAMGCPKQELFIYRHMDELKCSIIMGVGGSFDVLAGKAKRAPKWMIRMGLEWLYRVFMEPWRIKRLWNIPKFIALSAIYGKESRY